MAVKVKDEHQERIESLQAKTHLLIEKYQVLAKRHKDTEERLVQSERENLSLKQQIEQLKVQIEYLQVVSTINPSREELEQTKKILSDLVREINKCINDLTQ